MATINVRRPNPTVINKFLGLNMDTSGETQLKLGESPNMLNFQITENLKLRKRPGYTLVADEHIAIKGMWAGYIDDIYSFVYASDFTLYLLDLVTNASTVIGTVTNEEVLLFGYANKLYIADGVEFRSWDGTTYSVVAGYRPLVFVSTPPAGGGTVLEYNNQLTGAKRQKFSADGAASAYQLVETAIDSVDFVKLNGTTLTVNTHYTVDLVAGTVSPVTPADWPTGTVNNIEIGWTKGLGDRGSIARMKWATTFGASNDTRVFLWGDSQNPAYIYHSGLADGVPSAEYWPSVGFIKADGGTVTDCVRQQDKLNIYTNMDAIYASADFYTDDLGRVTAYFPTTMLHGALGQVAPGQTRLLDTSPFTMTFAGVQQWTTSGVKDERSAKYMSKNIQPGLDVYDIAETKTADWDSEGEFWMVMPDGTVFVYNYRRQLFYKYDDIPASHLLTVGTELYFGTTLGRIYKMDKTARSDNGVSFEYYWESGFLDFGVESRPKYIDRGWVAIRPDNKSGIFISIQTDDGAWDEPFEAEYNLIDFEHCDFGDWSFLCSTNPQPFRFRIHAKKFAYAKVKVYDNKTNRSAIVLSIDLSERVSGGELR